MFDHPLLCDLEGHEEEIDTIVHETILSYPLKFMISSANQTLHQLVTLRTGEEIRKRDSGKSNFGMILKVFPSELPAFSIDRQYLHLMLPLTNAFSRVHVVIFWLSALACILLAWTGGFSRINRFLAWGILFLIINAAICGASAGVYDRYQCRVAWIIPFCLTAYICCWVKARQASFGV